MFAQKVYNRKIKEILCSDIVLVSYHIVHSSFHKTEENRDK